ncbi:MAG: hypothetical protein ACI4RM_04895 [Ruminococcus sp.]
MNKVNEKKNKKLFIIILAVFLVVALAVGGVVVFNNCFAQKPVNSDGVVGKISDGWDTGIEDESVPKASGVQIPGYEFAQMNAGDMSLKLSIGNPKDNSCGFYATLKLEDGTVLYESELIKPGYGLTEVPLNQTLKSGEYTAMVIYQCVTLDKKHTPLNSAESEFKLIVK